MNAITVARPGGPEEMHLTQVPDPSPRDGELLVRVHATALNRADLMQRRGSYPVPPGASEIMGLELAGEVVGLGVGVTTYNVGDRIYGLAGAGGYGELATIHASLAMPIPEPLSYQEAAAIPEVFMTAHDALFTMGGLAAGQRALIHAGGSGVGTAGIQIARAAGAEVYVTAGTDEKCAAASALGAALAVNYKTQNFAEEIARQTKGQGVHVILDVVGADYWSANIATLTSQGRLILIGLMGGAEAAVDLGQLLFKRIRVEGAAMRSRSLEERALVTRRYQEQVEPWIRDGRVRPIIDRVFPLRDAAEAHAYMGANLNFGKIVLDVAGGV